MLWIEIPADQTLSEPLRSDPALVILFPLAMRLRERLVIEGIVSGELLLNVLEAMTVYDTYFPGEAMIVPIEATTLGAARSGSMRRGSFYSGGVDSLYNIAESERLARLFGTPRVTDLWLVQGMDVPLHASALWEQTRTRLSSIKHVLPGVRVVEVRTNAREVHGRSVRWEHMGFSPILGGLAKCFSADIPVALIGSARPYADIVPHASTPLVDPLWSCDAQMVRHFSARVNRSKKIATVGETYPALLENLRVCWENRGGAYNCGVCEKCLRTQMELELAGYLHLCRSFDVPLSVDSLARLKLPLDYATRYTLIFWRDIAASCREQGKLDHARLIERKLRFAGTIGKLTRNSTLKRTALSIRRYIRHSTSQS